ncbi:DUF1080 domain-containing protein [candidate division KSB1 bacterium]|nr:DUF1080 domain-containing protein [candidate division KSB1 bacterium]
MNLKLSILILLVISSAFFFCESEKIIFEDDFNQLNPGLFSVTVGAHTEYHYLPEAAPKGPWAVSAFTWNPDWQRAWRVLVENGEHIMYQSFENTRIKHTHPMLVAGDSLWQDYTLMAQFAPDSLNGLSGVVFRYQNDRCYYFFGFQHEKLVLKMVKHATAFHQPFEKILAEKQFPFKSGTYLKTRIQLSGQRIQAFVNGNLALEANDSTYLKGKIGLLADIPTRFREIKVTMSPSAHKIFEAQKNFRELEARRLQAQNPQPVLWKKISTTGFGVGRNLRFGDLNNDGQIDVLIGQVQHHGPKDRYSELSCLTAMTFDGEKLWQIGEPDEWKNHLTNDVSFQIHDLDRDGQNEVIYCQNFEIIVVDGTTGKTKYKAPTPAINRPEHRYPRILGDCLFFCDLRGNGYPQDIIIKDRYSQFWALNDRLEILWTARCKTGHYPYAFDVDQDGRNELAIGYSLFDDNGQLLWTLDDQIQDHADGVAIVQFKTDAEPIILNAASDEGIFFADLKGNILKHHYLGHVQNPAIANFRDDLPGLEAVSINFWGNQGILHFYDADGNIYQSCEPNQYGSMCLPINWTGGSEEYFVHSANVKEGGLFDGWGRCVVKFPADGHPDMCNAVLDIMGDCRDEVVVWDPYEIWVYTQSDNPKSGKLYKPVRNALYNYSNYQASVSLPGWGL